MAVTNASWVCFVLCCLAFSRTAAESLCKKSPRAGVFPCCPTAHTVDCCTNIKSCDKSLKTGRSLIQLYGFLQYKALCSNPINTTACLAGFYRDGSGKAQPCPPGFFCPKDHLCIIPCPLGAYCMPDKLITVPRGYQSICSRLGKCCKSVKGSISPAVLLENGSYSCPGAVTSSSCPERYFCKTATEKTKCPAGHYCREGTTFAKKCPPAVICGEGESAPMQNAIGPIITILLILFLIFIYSVFTNFGTLKILADHYWRAITGDLHYSVKDGIEHLIVTMEDFASCREAQIEPKEFTLDLSFTDLSLTLKGTDKRVLQSVTGEIRSSEVTAIMGPSGAGKTTLLNVVSDKAFYGVMEGEMRVNGILVPNLKKFKKVVGFVPQEDTMHRTLTVAEVLTYQAKLRLPPGLSNDEISAKVNQTLKLLEISHIKRSLIGDEEQRGISGGQRKRVNIGMELIADPTLLFLDEPTSGLDSTSSLTVLNALRKVAEGGRLTVACVIHQPRYEIFKMFHCIHLLAPGGRTVYEGSVPQAEEYFASIGFVIPEHSNPADYYMDVVGGAQSGDYSHDPFLLPEYWEEAKGSNKRDSIDSTIPEARTQTYEKSFRVPGVDRSHPNLVSQFVSILKREFVLQFRQVKTLLLDSCLVLLAGGVLGGLYREVKLASFLTMATMSAMGIGLVSCIPALRIFGQSRPVYWREAASGVNRFSYFLAGNVSQLPQIALMPMMYLSLQYTFTSPRGLLIDHYILYSAAWFANSGCGYFISCVFNPRNSQMAAVLFVLISSLLSGSSPTICTMDKVKILGPATYSLSYARWFLEAIYEAEVAYYAPVHQPTVDFLAYDRNYKLDSFRMCVLVLCGFGFVTRLLAFLSMIFMNRGKQQ